ncbi:nacht domain containing protein [Niveomyces insectorum RCEF 264]|uniref:Nacht domain containing protein n=1 Tax=Niveomyces insectorum RCEF 264 TaxID=1081102 RepID=A0A167RCD4_9HYPO|nr:nacht domain containing protein [Niveomyces insectorum RCEF 264]
MATLEKSAPVHAQVLPTVSLAEPQGAVAKKAANGLHVSVNEVAVTPSLDAVDDKQIVLASERASTTKSVSRSSTTSSQHPESLVAEAVQFVKGLFSKLGDYEVNMLHQANLESYLQYIADERLIHMPRKGSDWDRVLRTAQFFGLQIWRFGDKVGKFAPESRQAAASALASCQMLLEIGYQQSAALLPAFMTLYELGLLVSQITQIPGIFESTKDAKTDIGQLYSKLVGLAGGISAHYRKHVFNLGRRHHAITLNLDELFGSEIDAIWATKAALYERIWCQNLGKRKVSLELSDLRHRLNPESEAFRHALYAELAEDLERAEDTCEWIKNDLVDFFQSKEKVLFVSGAPGSGKTVLADWIEERLQRPLHNTTYSVLLYTFTSDDREEATVLAFLKGLLFQLLERSVGNIQLYESLANAFVDEDIRVHAHGQGGHKHSHDLEHALWRSLQIGLNTFKKSEEPIVLLIDGFEEAAGGQQAAIAAFYKSLQEHVFGVKNVRTITFSRHEHKLGGGIKHIAISGQVITQDIKSFLRQTLLRSPLFMELPPAQRETIIDDLSQKAKGSFLWARLAGNYLLKYHGYEVVPDHHHHHHQKQEHHTPADLVKAAAAISSELGDVLNAMESKLDLKGDHHLRNLLTFLLVSDAPLDVQDLSIILGVDVAGHAVGKAVDVAKLVARTVPDLVLVRDGRVRFKSSLIRAHLHKRLGKSLSPVKEAHHELVLRLLLYTKLSVHSSIHGDPTVDELDDATARRLFASHRLLHFVMAQWLFHFRASSQYQGNDVALSKDFRAVFPDSVVFALLERYAWASSSDLVSRLTLTLRIRETVFTEKHISVLQSLIVLGHVHVKLSLTIDGARYFYRAASLGQIVLSRFSSLAIACTDLFLHITDGIVFTQRTEIVGYRETLIRYKIDVCKERFGVHSEIVIEWHKKLAALYVAIKEEHLAALVYREIYEIIIVRDGKDSEDVRDLKKFLGGLDVTLKDFKSEKEIQGYGKLLLETAEDLGVTDVLYISILLRLAHSYEVDLKWHLAERIYISLWRKVSILSRTTLTVDVHIAKLQVALAYVAYLRSVKRVEEASNILTVLWTEYEHYSSESKEIVLYLREIGVLFKALGILTVAAGIFAKVWGWFKAHGKATDEEARHTTVLITEVVQEITETTITQKTTTTTTTETTEVVIHDIFATHYERCRKEHVDAAFFSAALALVNLYIARKNWGEAEVTIRKSLEISWKAVLTADVKIKLAEHYSRDVVRMATRLAVCYEHQRQFDQAESIYLRIYWAAKASLSIENELFLEALAGLVSFYEGHHRHDKVIEIYVELVEIYRKKLGAAHRLTIQALYTLAGQYEILGRREAYSCYIDIVAALNKGLKHCHRDAFKAAVALVGFYFVEKRWAELQVDCAVLWETFLHHHHVRDAPGDHVVYGFTEEVVTLIYDKYVYALQVHAKVDVSVLYEITVRYRETVTKVFGASAAIVVAALLALAAVCERSEKHHHEAVTIYEEIITKYKTTKTTTTTVTETTIHTVKKRLSTLYVTIITTGGKGTTVAGPKDVMSIDRALVITLEAFALLKLEFGIWHDTTLTKLSDVVVLYQKQNTKEAHAKLVLLLQTTVVEIISTLTVSVQLFKAASTLATVFVTSGLVPLGHSLLQQLRYLLVFGDALPAGITVQLDLKLTHAVNSNVVFLFVAAFEQQLLVTEKKKTTVSFSELLSSLLYEAFLYEEYRKVIDSSDVGIEAVLESGARLRGFWVEEAKSELLVVLDTKLFPVFRARYADYAKVTSDEHVRVFYLALLAELAKDKADASFAVIACKAGNAAVRSLLEAGEFGRALEVARFVFTFAAKQGFYKSEFARIAYGYRLAELLAGIDVRLPSSSSSGKPGAEVDIRNKLLALSREVTAEVFAVLAAEKVDLATLEVADVTGLVRLLGAQGDYARLEMLLLHLWRSREVRRNWRPATVLSIGFALVHAYAGQKPHKLDRAIDLADLLWYNLRRGRGWLDADAVRASQLLASLYIEAGRPAEALNVYESVLLQIDAAAANTSATTAVASHNGSNSTNGATAAHTEDADGDRALLAFHARQQLELLGAAHARLGRWIKPKKEYHDLYEHLRGSLGLKQQLPAAFDKWAATAAGTADKATLPGGYTMLQDWKIAGDVLDTREVAVKK